MTIQIAACKDGDIVKTVEGEYGIIIDKLNHIGSVQIRLLNRGESAVKTIKGREIDARWRNSKRPPAHNKAPS